MRICVRSRVWLTLMTVFGYVGLWAADGAFAQQPPQPLGPIANKSALNDRDRQQITQWARHWGDALAAGDPDRVEQARERLVEPLSSPHTSIFRTTYAEAVIDELQPAIKSNKPHVASNAIRVITTLGTESALEELNDYLTKTNENRWRIRLQAARGCMHIFDRVISRRLNVTQRPVNSVARELKAAVQQEDNILTLRRQLEALILAAQAVRSFANAPNTNEVGTVEEQLIEALEVVVSRIQSADQAPNEQMRALHPALARLRDMYVQLDRNAAARALGRRLAPVLGDTLEIADDHWQAAHEHENMHDTYQGVISAAEALLSVIDLRVRVNASQPNGNASAAWNDGNRAGFQTTVRAWDQILTGHPYQ